ncbi:MAG: tRNA 2-selenouridine(34) synthase MnmH [Rhodobacteraceae bacterium]|nr:tRNA 2-selenouridine(34) synthase MnmH [Paracoccaceae bacterium]
MAFQLANLARLGDAPFDTIIDVRAPSEFAEDHVPGAINLPVLDDEERARVGTIYKQVSPFDARKIGAALVARNAARHIEEALFDKPGGWRPLVYCWRGGQRSNSFATILGQIGWRVEVLEGGYRSYRRLVAGVLHDTPLPHRLILLDGNTGTAKTELLHLLAARGVQILDLEGLAAHRGSVFGPVAHPQPAQKAFESALAQEIMRLDPSRPVVVEAESSKVGDLLVPPSLWAAMCAAPRIEVAAPLQARAEYLTRAYADLTADPEALQQTIALLVPFQGREKVARWQEMASRAAHVELAGELMSDHYDPRYAKWRERQEASWLGRVEAETLGEGALGSIADRIADLIARKWTPAAAE